MNPFAFLNKVKLPGLGPLGVQELPAREVEQLTTTDQEPGSWQDVIPYIAVIAVFVVVVFVLMKKK